MENDYQLSDDVREKIEAEAKKYPSRRAAVKSALRYAQQEHGWVSEGVVNSVAALLSLQPIQVYEVATFYDMFYTKPVGRHRIRVCTNVSCMLRGSKDVLDQLQLVVEIDVQSRHVQPEGAVARGGSVNRHLVFIGASQQGVVGKSQLLLCLPDVRAEQVMELTY